MIGPLVETDWLESQLGADDLALLDGSWYLPAMNRNARQEFARGHIPGAAYFDIDVICEAASPLPHMLPAPGDFADAVAAMGISQSDRIVVYDGMGLFSAARVWWMFRAMGAPDVAVLNGGLKAWTAEDRPMETANRKCSASSFSPQFKPDWLRDIGAVKRASGDASIAIADARPTDRFTGATPEPRQGLRSGHMPGSVSMPVEVFVQEDGRMKPPAELAAAFGKAGVDLTLPVITTCGSGVTAAIPFLALHVLGKRDVSLYDGSWTEWGGLPDTAVETG